MMSCGLTRPTDRNHGWELSLRSRIQSAADRAAALRPGERLFLMPDFQNPEDPHAVALRTEDKVLLGYVPRYYCADMEVLQRAYHHWQGSGWETQLFFMASLELVISDVSLVRSWFVTACW